MKVCCVYSCGLLTISSFEICGLILILSVYHFCFHALLLSSFLGRQGSFNKSLNCLLFIPMTSTQVLVYFAIIACFSLQACSNRILRQAIYTSFAACNSSFSCSKRNKICTDYLLIYYLKLLLIFY